MSRESLNLTPELLQYLRDVSLREPEVLRELRAETAGREKANMQIAPEQGQFMALLTRLLGARRALDIGAYTGYSALSVALAMPAEGRVVACDVSEERTAIARKYWARAGVADRIDLRLGPALETLDALLADGAGGLFDFAFIDADKENDWNYFERSLELLRPGGLILIDNVLWGGSVIDPEVDDEETEAIRELNRKVQADQRVEISMLPVADGITLALKR